MLRGDPAPANLAPVVEADAVLALQEAAERVRVDESILDYLVALVTATRRSPLLAWA